MTHLIMGSCHLSYQMRDDVKRIINRDDIYVVDSWAVGLDTLNLR